VGRNCGFLLGFSLFELSTSKINYAQILYKIYHLWWEHNNGHSHDIEVAKSEVKRIGLLELIRHKYEDNIKSNNKELSPCCGLLLSGKYF
jgi:hypothetical protein